MKNNKKGNSILIAILMIGFLLVLVVGMFNLMLRDMKDNRGAGNYLKSYAGAEGAMELGLLKIKEKGYGVDEDLSETNSGILSFNSGKKNEPKISYKMDIGTNNFSGSLKSGETVIIPLFSNFEGSLKSTYSPMLTITDGTKTDLIWNIIGYGEGMSGSGEINFNNSYDYKQNRFKLDGTIDKDRSAYDKINIKRFLEKDGTSKLDDNGDKYYANNSQSYLMLFNKSTSSEIKYNLKVPNGELFSKPVGTIISSVTVGKFRQNITTKIDNTEFLNMLKYSLYSK